MLTEFTREQILENRRRIGDLPPLQEPPAAVEKDGTTLNRAYSTFEIKAASTSDGKRRFVGVASTISTDLMNDVVEPKGMQATLPAPLLWMHDASQPIGWVKATRVSGTQIEADFEVATVSEPPALKERLDSAWASIVSGLVRGLSIGFRPLETARIADTGGTRFLRWTLLEISAVTIAANSDCGISQIRSTDQAARAMAGQSQAPQRTDKGAAGTVVARFKAALVAGDAAEADRLRRGEDMAKELLVYTFPKCQKAVKDIWDEKIAKGREPLVYTKDVHDTFMLLIKGTMAEVAALRAQREFDIVALDLMLKEMGNLEYKGVFKSGETYDRGSFVTFGGSLWHSGAKTTDAPPGGAWTLAVRRGADGRDAR
jgi:HK97 family phage prohead protease